MTIEELLSELKEQPSQDIQVALLELLNAGK